MRKADNVKANRGFFCVNSIHTSFVNQKLINKTYPEKWGTLCAIFCQKRTISSTGGIFFLNNQKSTSKVKTVGVICIIGVPYMKYQFPLENLL